MDDLGDYFWNAAKVFPELAKNVKSAIKDIVNPNDEGAAEQNLNSTENKTLRPQAVQMPKTVLKAPPFGMNRRGPSHASNLPTRLATDIQLPFEKPSLSSTTMKYVDALNKEEPVPQKSLIKLNSADKSPINNTTANLNLSSSPENPYTLSLDPSLRSNSDSALASYNHGIVAQRTHTTCQAHSDNVLDRSCRTCFFQPLCKECLQNHEGHSVMTISEAAGDVIDILRECLSAVIDRHNVVESLLPEIKRFSETSETMLKNVKRSVDKSTTCLLDNIKAREDSAMAEISQLLSLGSEKLNSLYKDSIVYSKYIAERLKTLDDLEKTASTNVGLALNTFIDLKPEYERLIYQCQDIPLLGQPLIQHWHVNPGNIQNLISTEEVYITNSCRKISEIWNSLNDKVKDMANDIEMGKYQYNIPSQPALDPPLLVGTFLRKDWRRKEWMQRVVTIRPPLLIIHAHPDDPNEKIESSFDIASLNCQLFEDSINPYTREAYRQHSHGLEIEVVSEHPHNVENITLLASTSSSIPRIWLQALREVGTSPTVYPEELEEDIMDPNSLDRGDEAYPEEREEFSPKIRSGLEPGQEGRGSPSHLSFLKYGRGPDKKYEVEDVDVEDGHLNENPDVYRSPVHFTERQSTTETERSGCSKKAVDVNDPYSLNKEWSTFNLSSNRSRQKKAVKFDGAFVNQFTPLEMPESDNDV